MGRVIAEVEFLFGLSFATCKAHAMMQKETEKPQLGLILIRALF